MGRSKLWIAVGVMGLAIASSAYGQGRVVGRVLNADTGEPVAGAFVAVDHTGDAAGANLKRFASEGLYATNETDETGAFILEGLAFRDNHPMHVTREGFVRHETKISLSEANAERRLDIRLTPAGSIAGTVRDSHGEALAHVTVMLTAHDGRVLIPRGEDSPVIPSTAVRTDEEGRFAFTDLDTGIFTVELTQGPRFLGYRDEIQVIRPEATEIEMVTATGVGAAIEVTAPPPLATALFPPIVILSRKLGPLVWQGGPFHPEDHRLGRIMGTSLMFVRLDSEGKVSIAGLPPGRYALYVMANRPIGERMARSGVFVPGQAVDVAEDSRVQATFGEPVANQVGPAHAGALYALNRPHGLEPGDRPLGEVLSQLTEVVLPDASFVSDEAIGDESVAIPSEATSVWDLLEGICFERDWSITAERREIRVVGPK